MNDIKQKDRTYKIRGAVFEVYNILGPGFLESVYHEALKKEFESRKIPYQSEVELDVFYKNIKLDTKFRADFICYNSIILEIKACNYIKDIHRAQLLNYMKTCSINVGLLINFNSSPNVDIARLVL